MWAEDNFHGTNENFLCVRVFYDYRQRRAPYVVCTTVSCTASTVSVRRCALRHEDVWMFTNGDKKRKEKIIRLQEGTEFNQKLKALTVI